jgi:hypothetical protein
MPSVSGSMFAKIPVPNDRPGWPTATKRRGQRAWGLSPLNADSVRTPLPNAGKRIGPALVTRQTARAREGHSQPRIAATLRCAGGSRAVLPEATIRHTGEDRPVGDPADGPIDRLAGRIGLFGRQVSFDQLPQGSDAAHWELKRLHPRPTQEDRVPARGTEAVIKNDFARGQSPAPVIDIKRFLVAKLCGLGADGDVLCRELFQSRFASGEFRLDFASRVEVAILRIGPHTLRRHLDEAHQSAPLAHRAIPSSCFGSSFPGRCDPRRRVDRANDAGCGCGRVARSLPGRDSRELGGSPSCAPSPDVIGHAVPGRGLSISPRRRAREGSHGSGRKPSSPLPPRRVVRASRGIWPESGGPRTRVLESSDGPPPSQDTPEPHARPAPPAPGDVAPCRGATPPAPATTLRSRGARECCALWQALAHNLVTAVRRVTSRCHAAMVARAA